MSSSVLSFFAVAVFALVHLLAPKTKQLSHKAQGNLLSTGSGFALAYVFIDLLPKLGDLQVSFEKWIYLLALLGFLLFFSVERSPTRSWFSLGAYSLFNFFVGYAVRDPYDPEVQPLFLFTVAVALHFFANDFSITNAHPQFYGTRERWILVAALFLGWFVGIFWQLDQTAISLVTAFIAGGIIMNVMRHELPKKNPHNLAAFYGAVLLYALILLI